MRPSRFPAIIVVCLAAFAWSALGRPRPSSRQAIAVADDGSAHRATIDRYCAGCHNSRATSAATASGVVLDRADLNQVADDPALWEKVIRKLRIGGMPPEGSPRPDRSTQDALAGFIESRLDRVALERPNPGR